MKDHGLGHLRGLGHHGLRLEGCIGRTLSAGGLMGLDQRSVYSQIYRILDMVLTLLGVDVFFEIAQRLVEFQIAACLIQGSVDAFVELLLLHVHHLRDIGELHEEQYDERQSHDYGNDPNRSFLHVGKVNAKLRVRREKC